MNVIPSPFRAWLVEWAVLGLHALPWSACSVMLVTGVVRILSERSRRKTLLAITTQSPPGTVVAQERGTGGPKMMVQVGGEPASCPERHS
ncbi:hypothetical protein K4B79_00645 [Streptomyces lincolnensis]|uniref:hypothetical protein n=1 Tax=Streptomyces lincolnensis TaxID=1915 RepID=UPI001E515E71|nr:hypothetical protein [Streptomyces lincolnensis]MCD7436723.1 hypothetical protein [Streptomyces lincolnensis]